MTYGDSFHVTMSSVRKLLAEECKADRHLLGVQSGPGGGSRAGRPMYDVVQICSAATAGGTAVVCVAVVRTVAL